MHAWGSGSARSLEPASEFTVVFTKSPSCLLIAYASTRTQQIKCGVVFESCLHFLLVCARMLLCGFYLLNVLALSPHLCRAGYNVFQTTKLCSFSPTPLICLLALIRARPAACGSCSPSGSPVDGADCSLMRRARHTRTRLDAGCRCSIKCYPRNCGVSNSSCST